MSEEHVIPSLRFVSTPNSTVMRSQRQRPVNRPADAPLARPADGILQTLHPGFQHPLDCMARSQKNYILTRRAMLKGLGATPLLLRAAPLIGMHLLPGPSPTANDSAMPFAEHRYSPHYPIASDLADILQLVEPGSDSYITERYALQLEALLKKWGESLQRSPKDHTSLASLLEPDLEASPLTPVHEKLLRSGFGLEITQRQFSSPKKTTPAQHLQQVEAWLGSVRSVNASEFEIYEIEVLSPEPLTVHVAMRYDLAATRTDEGREERVGDWRMTWAYRDATWKVRRWEASSEVVSLSRGEWFVDISSHALGGNPSYPEQLLHGVDHWRTILDGACGTDIYANNGIATGDYDNDGFDDIYVCQPAGLPNRLYRNQGDGTFEDVSAKAGVDVLDNTACALFADFDNRGRQDLLVVCGSGPLLFRNQGDGTFALWKDAFQFTKPPQGTFTHAAIADCDGDGRLDIYFCTYMYYLGLDQYHYPAPYYDARNGPPNLLLHNEGNGRFVETTEAAGLNVQNNRYSFACAWGDSNGDGHPDLCIANDFGTSQLYRNNGDGTFRVASSESHIEDVGAGMSACWADYNNDGHQDIYITSMWEAAGQRVSGQQQFHPDAPQNIRTLYQRHARGNALYRNHGDGTFDNAGQQTGTAMGRWSWSADFWDVDHDGFPDLYVTNGYISAAEESDLASFFWRQVVAKSPGDSTPNHAYERGWNAINDLIRSDHSWNAHERNVMFANNRDGTFSEVSSILGLDCLEDSRSFALADLDHDGRLEIIVKNRDAPQIRVLHNNKEDIGSSISFRLRGVKSNRDAIGARISLESGTFHQTRYLQAGSGFLAQHSKEIFFGLGRADESIKATVRWPNGSIQIFPSLPANHRIEIEEGTPTFNAIKFTSSPVAHAKPSPQPGPRPLPLEVETWLAVPLRAPNFMLADQDGQTHDLRKLRGRFALLHFWSTDSQSWRDQLRGLKLNQSSLDSAKLSLLPVNMDGATRAADVRNLLAQERFPFPALVATDEVAGIYNLTFRHLYDRRRNLPLPTSFLLDADGMIVKVYQGTVNLQHLLEDVRIAPKTAAERTRLAIPFPGQLLQGTFQRNDFTYGVAFFQHGYLDQAAESFAQVVASRPNDPEAYYNLGTLSLRRNDLTKARHYLDLTIQLKPDYPEAWNNLGMIAAQQGESNAAINNFKRAIDLRPDYGTALLNLGNVHRHLGDLTDAGELLRRALSLQPDEPEVNYSLGMLHAQQNQLQDASTYLLKAIAARPAYPEALNNLGIIYVRLQKISDAEEEFKTAIRAVPENDQAYLNLAKLYMLNNDRDRARSILQDLVKLQPQNAKAAQALDLLR
jgi:Flp pilus assembly protein TadD/peroxiredoxin